VYSALLPALCVSRFPETAFERVAASKRNIQTDGGLLCGSCVVRLRRAPHSFELLLCWGWLLCWEWWRGGAFIGGFDKWPAPVKDTF
jgi:hypothetical protein